MATFNFTWENEVKVESSFSFITIVSFSCGSNFTISDTCTIPQVYGSIVQGLFQLVHDAQMLLFFMRFCSQLIESIYSRYSYTIKLFQITCIFRIIPTCTIRRIAITTRTGTGSSARPTTTA